MNNKIIEIANLSKKDIIKDINLTINKKEVVAIMGYSGSGKTTLLNLMSGLDRATSGSINILNTEVTSLKEPKLTKFRSQNIAYIFQDYKLVQYLTIDENVKLLENINKHKIDNNKLQNIYKKLNLGNLLDKKIDLLSGGQKQRVAIARSLIGNNELIFADEPTGALDLITREVIIDELITNANDFNKTLVIITHDPFVASKADRVVFINGGTIESINEKMTEKNIITKMKELFKNV